MNQTNTSRRSFGKFLAAGTAASLIPGRVLGANEKVNVAFIGCGGMGGNDAKTIFNTGLVNPVALCDVAMGTGHTAGIEEMFPGIPKFKDFREMFDKMEKDIDAVTVGVPDHSHFPIAMTAMSLGKGVYVEKPLAHTFQECALMMAAEKKYKVAAQMGNQGHSGGNYFQWKEWTEKGIINGVTRIDAYMNKGRRWHPWTITDYPEEAMPEQLDWDTWLGTRAERPFSGKLHPGNWRSWYEFGNGAFGDWGPHILDTAHRFLELGYPTKISAVKREEPKKLIFPKATTIRFDFAARGKHPACEVNWYDGTQNLPPKPEELEPERNIGRTGKIVYGKDLTFIGGTHGATIRVLPEEKMRELAPTLPKIPRPGSDHYENWVLSVKGEEQCRSSFDVAAPLSQVFCLGVIAQRLGGELEFDAKTQRITNNKVADALLQGPPPRKGWEQYYKM